MNLEPSEYTAVHGDYRYTFRQTRYVERSSWTVTRFPLDKTQIPPYTSVLTQKNGFSNVLTAQHWCHFAAIEDAVQAALAASEG